MIISEQWIRELASPAVDTGTLAHGLTMAGLKVDAIDAAAPKLDGIVAARITACDPHPDADKLTVCKVDSGSGTHTIVCGANNVFVGMTAPLARPGSTLPGGHEIKATELRGITSEGMLCSGRELGLSDDHDGLLELPEGLAPGSALDTVFGSGDRLFELDLTPNRGDCLSTLGVAREVAAIFQLPAPAVDARPVAASHDEARKVSIAYTGDCPAYYGRVIKGVDTQRKSPMWLQEKLRRAGVRPLGAAVDVTAYVMLELGQPMHAFDNSKLQGTIHVRRGVEGESLQLLDGQSVTLDTDILLITDDSGPIALAGVMGGEATSVGEGTRDVFLESAHFTPLAVVNRARRYGLHTDASQRFERGVDPALPGIALERATRLLIEIAGGEAGPVVHAGNAALALRKDPITLRRSRIRRLLGVLPEDGFIEDALGRLQMKVKPFAEGWEVSVPSFRFDLELEADLIEEIARLYGYEKIPSQDGLSPMLLHPMPDAAVPEARLAEALVQRGYQQVITYSFVDPALQTRLGLSEGAMDLSNPISSELAQMRTSLWPGLLMALSYNANRQQGRVRIFESGLKFVTQGDVLEQKKVFAGLVWGDRHPLQWGATACSVDFYDIKADCETLLALGGVRTVSFEVATHPSLHPGQTARILKEGKPIGWVGALHPGISRDLDLAKTPFLFEMDAEALLSGMTPAARPVSRFPALRRDLALVVPEAVTVGQILVEVDAESPEWVTERFIFDIYRGKGVEPGLKSIALGLILQETSRTLTDSEADGFVQKLVARLGRSVQATLRD